jgi:hypothetical protein
VIGVLGFQPSSVRAKVISGRRTSGSSAGRATWRILVTAVRHRQLLGEALRLVVNTTWAGMESIVLE